MVQNALQADDVLFGSGNAADALPDNSTVMLCSTVSPLYVRELNTKLTGLSRGIKLVDAPVSGGVVRAANGSLTVSCILFTTLLRTNFDRSSALVTNHLYQV